MKKHEKTIAEYEKKGWLVVDHFPYEKRTILVRNGETLIIKNGKPDVNGLRYGK